MKCIVYKRLLVRVLIYFRFFNQNDNIALWF